MDDRAAKLALARKKLKDHQDKKNQENVQTGFNQPNNGDQNANVTNDTCLVTQVNKDNKTNYSSEECKPNQNIQPSEAEINATEFLISSKRSLELHVNELQARNTELENSLTAINNKYEITVQKLNALENDLKNIHFSYNSATEQLMLKDNVIKELNAAKASDLEERSNLQEQLEFTKTMLSAKEAENDSLHSQLYNIQNQLDASQLQLQQLTSGTHNPNHKHTQQTLTQENEMLLQKVSHLEQQLKSQLKDYQQINSHYEHYVGELNEQLKSVTRKNEELARDLHNLSNRENSLIEQISEMEIRLQNYNSMVNYENNKKTDNYSKQNEIKIIQEKYDKLQAAYQNLGSSYEEVQKLLNESNAKIEELNQSRHMDCNTTSEVSLVKLNADIASDKVAAQRATEQNKKLKQTLQGVEETVVKMTSDKLELTEKLNAEKYLNRELTIKLAEIDEKANNQQITLKAKDEEMIRLQATYRMLEREYEELKQKLSNSKDNYNNNGHKKQMEECINTENKVEDVNDFDNRTLIVCSKDNSAAIPTGDAMFKLQERFLKIMEEVADLSDEKHRLEHIILQLQNETDTICEYVALYQQQRSLLKKRDEERSAQIKIYKSECDRLQNQLDELTGILRRFADDKDLSSYFQVQTKHEDIQKVMSLLSNMKTSSLLDPHKTLELNNFYPCSCCSGQLIDV